MNGSTGENVLALQDICFRYPDGSRGLDHCTLALRQSSRTAVLGANGSGKTTFFLHLNGILRPQVGTVLYKGNPLDYGRQGLHELRSRIGLVFQNPDSQLFSASVREDVSFGPLNQGLSKQATQQRVEEALCSVGMIDCADKPVHNLSYGQKKRVCIAGVLAMGPEIMVLDEPMAGLDHAMQNDLERLLHRLHEGGRPIVLSTHDTAFAYRWADRFLLLDRGQCVGTCSAAQFVGCIEQLQALGLGVPDVVHLHRLLTLRGILPAAAEPPRSVADLAYNIEQL